MAEQEIKHDGIIQSIKNGVIRVSIITKSACISCKMNTACNISEVQEKIIEVKSFDRQFKVGDNVVVSLQESAGIKALIIGYMVPFLILLFSLIILTQFIDNEGIAGLISLAILVPYFLFLFLFRSKLKKQFSFFIHKQ